MSGTTPFVAVLGIAQDGGRPQAGCRRSCCVDRPRLTASCLGIVDPLTRQRWIIDATPDITLQLTLFDQLTDHAESYSVLDGVLLTHAHMGHYAGLVHLGREALATPRISVFARPSMADFLRSNSPWRELSEHGHVEVVPFDETVELSASVSVMALAVPHRDELSDTVGFIISGPDRRVLWLPDIDGWGAWDRSLVDVVNSVDVAYVDGTFFDDGELERDMSKIPHPRVLDTVQRISTEAPHLADRVRFIHLNHTNPVLLDSSPQRELVISAGMSVADEGETFEL